MIAEAIQLHAENDAASHQGLSPRGEKDDSDTTSKRPPGILVVDDDSDVRDLLEIVLRRQGFAVWLTADGYQALQRYRGSRDDIDLVLIDVRMPELDGPQTLAALQQVNPKIRCCFMTADPGHYTEGDLMDRGAERIIYKPFRVDQIVPILQELLNGASAPGSSINEARSKRTYDLTADVSTEWQLFAGRLR